MTDYLELPWSIEDTIENMKLLKEIVSEMAKRKNYDGKGKADAKEIEHDFDLAISALEKKSDKNCSRCVDRNRCAIHNNFNIDYCSDWRVEK